MTSSLFCDIDDILPWGHTASSPSRGDRRKGTGDWDLSQSFDEELRTPGERRASQRRESQSNISLSQSHASYSVSNNGLDDSQTSQSYGRRAFQHQSANPRLTIKHADSSDSVDDRALRSITYNRMKFYGKIAPANRENALVMPIHAAPPSLFSPLWFISGKKGTQSSLVSILSIWNTMMGTSVLAMYGCACAALACVVVGGWWVVVGGWCVVVGGVSVRVCV